MGEHLQKLRIQRNHGKSMPTDILEQNLWDNHNWSPAAFAPPKWLLKDERGWPIHPNIEVSLVPQQEGEIHHRDDKNALRVEWVQIRDGEKEVLEKYDIPLNQLIIWPGGKNYDLNVAHLLGTKLYHPINAIERIRAFRIGQEIVAENLSPKVPETLNKLTGLEKLAGLDFLTSHLPKDPEKREESIERRCQFLLRNPKWVAWINCSKKLNGAATFVEHLLEEPLPYRPERRFFSDFYHDNDHPKGRVASQLRVLIEFVEQGKTDQEICELLWNPTKEGQCGHTAKKDTLLALLANGNLSNKTETFQMLETRADAIADLLEKAKSTEPIQTEIIQTLERAERAFLGNINTLQANPKALLSRVKHPWDHTGYQTILRNWHEGDPKSLEEKLADFLRTDSINMFLIHWQALRLGKETEKQLQKKQSKLPEEKRHPIIIPDATHIRDFLLHHYKTPVPTNLAPEKLIDRIRRWDAGNPNDAQKALEEPDIHIPPGILHRFPPFLEGKNWNASILETKHKFEKESIKMKHCVRGYFTRAQNGEIAIYHVKQGNQHYTAEVRPNLTIVQFRGVSNVTPPTELKAQLAAQLKNKRATRGPSLLPKSLPVQKRELLQHLRHRDTHPSIEIINNQPLWEVIRQRLEPHVAELLEQDINAGKIVPVYQSDPEKVRIVYLDEEPTYQDISKTGERTEPRKIHLAEIEEELPTYSDHREECTLTIVTAKKHFLLEQTINDVTTKKKIPYLDNPVLEILSLPLEGMPQEKADKILLKWALEHAGSLLQNSAPRNKRRKDNFYTCEPRALAQCIQACYLNNEKDIEVELRAHQAQFLTEVATAKYGEDIRTILSQKSREIQEQGKILVKVHTNKHDETRQKLTAPALKLAQALLEDEGTEETLRTKAQMLVNRANNRRYDRTSKKIRVGCPAEEKDLPKNGQGLPALSRPDGFGVGWLHPHHWITSNFPELSLELPPPKKGPPPPFPPKSSPPLEMDPIFD